MFANLTRTRAFLMLACIAAILTMFFTGCSVTRSTMAKREMQQEKSDSSFSATEEIEQKTTAEGEAKTGQTATEDTTEKQANETVEEITQTEYDPATGKPARVTTTKRKSNTTAERAAALAWALQDTRAWRYTDDYEAERTQGFESHSELQKEKKEKDTATKSSPAIGKMLIAAGGVFLLVSVVWAFHSGGGPLFWILALFRRKSKQADA